MANPLMSEKQSRLYRQQVQRMPEGYYSEYKPNPFIAQALQCSESTDVAAPTKDIGPLDHTIAIANRRSVVNDLHVYWSKKPYEAVKEYIEHFTRAGDLVVDPFCGSGGALLACSETGRRCVGIDASPAAVHIAAGYVTSLTETEIGQLTSLLNDISTRMRPLSLLSVDSKQYQIESVLYSERLVCQKCLEVFPIATEVTDDGPTGICPSCTYQNNQRSRRAEFRSGIPVSMDVSVNGKQRITIGLLSQSKETEAFHGLESEINTKATRLSGFLTNSIAVELLDFGGRLRTAGVLRVRDLFTNRSLLFLSEALDSIHNSGATEGVKRSARFILTGCSLNLSKMYRARTKGGGPSSAMFYVPPVRREINPLKSFIGKSKTFLKFQEWLGNNATSNCAYISCEDASNIRLPSGSVDYIFTDPPYADTMPYGALNHAWEAILSVDSEWRRNEARGDRWGNVMSSVFSECFRILKPGAWVSVCYHDTSAGTWDKLQDLMAEIGFIADQLSSAIAIETNQKAYQQTVADKVTRRDLVVNFRKPLPGEIASRLAITGDEDQQTFSEKVHSIIRDYLTANPGAAKDRIYDEVVSNMVRAGRMEPHDFDKLLPQIAEEVREPVRKNLFENHDTNLFGTHEMGRWYLKESEMAVVDSAESAKEDAAASSIGLFITEYLIRNRAAEGVHYSDIFEHFVYAVKDKPRRQLADWLLDYFYKTDTATYRLPVSAEEEHLKKQGRAAGTNRRIKRYIAYLQQGVAVPEKERPNDSTLAEWIRSAKRSGMYEAGKLLYEKGGLNPNNLPEELMVNVEEDYQVCARMLARSADQPRPRKKNSK